MRILITGRGGTGKTMIHQSLLDRGYNSIDADNVPGLARMEDKTTGEPVDVDYSKFVDYSRVSWNWNGKVLERILEQPNVIVCGSATNQLDYYDLFDKVFVLSLDKDTHRRRLQNRSSEYGKDAATMRWILSAQSQLVKDSLAAGAITLDASEHLEQTLDTLEEYLRDYPRVA